VENYSEEYWNQQYLQGKTRWDIGYVSPPLKSYFDQLSDKNIRILVPGGGNAYEVEYLYKNSFLQTYLLDFSTVSNLQFISRFPEFPAGNIFNEDFFQHTETYDLIVEQTFLSSLLPERRAEYVDKMASLLNTNGKLVALLFNHQFPNMYPPFGGIEDEYKMLFSEKFDIIHFSLALNSIKPRCGRELFILLQKKYNC
jgi:hypothetical protein